MNYISEINAFNDWCEQHYLPMEAQYLWYKLMSKNNRLDWCEWMQVANYELMSILGTSREATAIGVRNKLIEAGLLQFVKGKKGTPNKYRLISLSQPKAQKTEKGNTLSQMQVKSVVESVVKSAVKSVVESADNTKQNKTKQNEKVTASPISPSGTTPSQTKKADEDEADNDASSNKKADIGETKLSFGEFGKVKLTQEENRKLTERFGETAVSRKIESLDIKLQEKVKKYCAKKDHYLTILGWCKRDAEEAEADNQPNERLKSKFEEFIGVYPKQQKIYEAEKKWIELNPDDRLCEEIIAAVKAAAKSKEWCEENGRYIPQPANWLEKKRWLDKLTVIGADSGVDGQALSEPAYRVTEMTAEEKRELERLKSASEETPEQKKIRELREKLNAQIE